MANIDFGETPGEQLATLMVIVNGLNLIIHGNGQLGLKDKAERFMNEYNGALIQQEKHRLEQHTENSEKLAKSNTKLNFVIALAALATVFTGIGTLILMLRHP